MLAHILFNYPYIKETPCKILNNGLTPNMFHLT